MKRSILLAALFIFASTFEIFAQPAGTVVAFAGPRNKVPVGWIICDGTLYDGSNRVYAALYKAIGKSWGGNGANKFAVPDLRGFFLRGVTEKSGADPDGDRRAASRTDLAYQGGTGNNVGSKQPDQVGRHSHHIPRGLQTREQPHNDGGGFNHRPGGTEGYDRGVATDEYVSSETRPKNAYVYYIIKL